MPTHQPRSFCSRNPCVNTVGSPHILAAWPSGSSGSRAQLLLCSPQSEPAREEKPSETNPFRSVHVPFLFQLKVIEKVKYVNVEQETDAVVTILTAACVQTTSLFNSNQGSLIYQPGVHIVLCICTILCIECDLLSSSCAWGCDPAFAQTPSGRKVIAGKWIMRWWMKCKVKSYKRHI